MTAYEIAAPGKLNLCLYLGPTRADGLHEIVSLFESVSLHDQLAVRLLDGAVEDSVICPGVEGDNLVSQALKGARAAGLLDGPPLEFTIEKRIPVAAGMGGGSADAAAALRIVAELKNHPLAAFDQLAFAIGSDIPSQLRPGASLVHGAGERVVPVDPRCLDRAERAYVIVAQNVGLATAEVFAQADRVDLADPDLIDRENALLEDVSAGLNFRQLCALVENALEPAILALRPELMAVPTALENAGAQVAAFTGSGPTCFGVFESAAQADDAAATLVAEGHRAYAAVPVDARFAQPRKTL